MRPVELNLQAAPCQGLRDGAGYRPGDGGQDSSGGQVAIRVPVFSKLTPNTHRLIEVAKAVEGAEGDGVVAINALKAMAISVEFRQPVLSNRYGGLWHSGQTGGVAMRVRPS